MELVLTGKWNWIRAKLGCSAIGSPIEAEREAVNASMEVLTMLLGLISGM